MLELLVAACLIALNGVLSLSELAIVSARKSRLKTMIDSGRAGATTALRLSETPGRFLSTVQIGITLVGVLAGAFSGAALGANVTAWLRQQGLSEWMADPLGYGLVLGLITYFSVVVGELAPKHLALRDPEAIACVIAPPMEAVSRFASPLVWLLDASTRIVLWLFGQPEEPDNAVTEQEIKSLVAEAATAGVIEGEEHRMISGVLRLGDRAVRAVMTPRREVEWLDVTKPVAALREALRATEHSRLPVSEGERDEMIGVVEVRELLNAALAGDPLDVRAHVRQAPVVPDTLDALGVLNVLRETAVPMALVHDEYGHFEGLVTPADILDAIAGAFRSDEDLDGPEAVRREDGSWLISGSMPVDEMAETLFLDLPHKRDYQTAAGFVIGYLHHMPATGEYFDAYGWRFEVVDLDGLRVDKILARRLTNGNG
ncbi:hemolysin family protein [Methylocapsa palsarum]|uniref:Putative hemolysin n=1 Tax=Methylocapsa palsarum TaxID=1612308 RepID=A0A1I3X2C7_9HYPH|nr:hemolysin family protein [Methylocapsa palsarum]SFK12981.1 putative hemolysin [Methylocapsa palsarum]